MAGVLYRAGGGSELGGGRTYMTRFQLLPTNMQQLLVTVVKVAVRLDDAPTRDYLGVLIQELYNARVTCPRCNGDGGDVTGVPFDEEYGQPLCDLCAGRTTVSPRQATAYFTGVLDDVQ